MNKNNISFQSRSACCGKKGISAIVATVLIILITVAAVTIIWAAIIPMINSQLDKGIVCLDAVSQVQLRDEGYTCILNESSGDISLQIGRGAKDFDLADIQVLISVEGSTKSVNLVRDGLYTMADLPGPNGVMVFIVSSSAYGNATEVQIAPVINIGKTQESCDVSAKKMLNKC